jgi:hypothetical protein
VIWWARLCRWWSRLQRGAAPSQSRALHLRPV